MLYSRTTAKSYTCERGAPCSDTGGGLTDWKAALLEKPGTLTDSTLTMDQQQHASAESENASQLPKSTALRAAKEKKKKKELYLSQTLYKGT